VHLRHLAIKNFRVIDDITVDFDDRVNVIVGPNAVGKTTVLEAIRLAKAMLAARTPNESMQALFSLGAASPHMPQRMILDAVARDPTKNIDIDCRYEVSESELSWLNANAAEIARGLVQARMGQTFANPAVLIQFLASEPGKAAHKQATEEVRKATDACRSASRTIRLNLIIQPGIGPSAGGDPMGASLFSALEQRHPPNHTIFSYFPADRALPSGEQPVQLGGPDASQQLESHNSTPQTKYARLKNTIFGALVMSKGGREQLDNEFKSIFSGILKGRELVGCGINEIGLLSIKVKDTDSGRVFDLDGMSSGEKGLILTFLLIERSVAEGGLILLDEPELHLNPAVCKDLLAYLVDGYVLRKNLQLIVCSHSPEILAGALDREECSLYHLVSEKMLTKVRRSQREGVADALRRLGTSEVDGLLFKATLFVEGEDDVALLQAGFGDLLRKYNLKDLGGRREVEKQIQSLQEAEAQDEKVTPRYFIFDRDEAPSGLTSSSSIKVVQWERRCMENYLIELDILSDLLMDREIVAKPLANQGEVTNLLRTLALSQLDQFVARRVYSAYDYENSGLRAQEIKGKGLEEIGDILFDRLARIRTQIDGLDKSVWRAKFVSDCGEMKKQLEVVWTTTWPKDCDGKRLFRDLAHLDSLQIRMPVRRFKVRVMNEMRNRSTEGWRTIDGILRNLLEA
jgi:predicted ATPase